LRLATLAPGKVNLCLFVGEPRADGLHPLVSIVQPVALADELEMTEAERDEVVCPGVEGPNLAERAIALFREATGWDGPPVRITIAKRVPVAAGMGGGSSDAAATLRLLAAAAGTTVPADLAPRLGSDVPALLHAEPTLVTGAGEHVQPLAPTDLALVIVPSEHGLSTPTCAGAPGRPSTTSRRRPARCARRSATRSRPCERRGRTWRWSPAPGPRCSASSRTRRAPNGPRPPSRAPWPSVRRGLWRSGYVSYADFRPVVNNLRAR
jgi:4-diphosphocytidyl-2C-methyl-D-erythritol kinase